jgi:hypothetical protein
MKEENDEYLEAVLWNDLVEIADALEINFTSCRNYFNPACNT